MFGILEKEIPVKGLPQRRPGRPLFIAGSFVKHVSAFNHPRKLPGFLSAIGEHVAPEFHIGRSEVCPGGPDVLDQDGIIEKVEEPHVLVIVEIPVQIIDIGFAARTHHVNKC